MTDRPEQEGDDPLDAIRDIVDPRDVPHAREVWWQDWRWWASVAAVLGVLAALVFGIVAFRSQTIDRLELARTRFENTCRSQRAAAISLPTANQTSATGRGLVIALAGDRPQVRALVEKYIKGSDGKSNDELFLEQAEKLLVASNAIDAARKARADAEEDCASEALSRYPG